MNVNIYNVKARASVDFEVLWVVTLVL